MVAYVRAGHSPIRERGVIGNPDLVVVVDASLIPVPAAGVLLGVRARTVMLIHSPIAADESIACARRASGLGWCGFGSFAPTRSRQFALRSPASGPLP
jgi:hypothetical protein